MLDNLQTPARQHQTKGAAGDSAVLDNLQTPYETVALSGFCVCVWEPMSRGISILSLLSRGAVGVSGVTAQRRHSRFAVISISDARLTYLHSKLRTVDCSVVHCFLLKAHKTP